MDQNNPLNEQFILSNEEGEEMAFRFLDLILYREQEYLVLLPAEGPYLDEVVILRRVKGEGPGEESYEDVEDSSTVSAVYRLFQENNRDRFIFTD